MFYFWIRYSLLLIPDFLIKRRWNFLSAIHHENAFCIEILIVGRILFFFCLCLYLIVLLESKRKEKLFDDFVFFLSIPENRKSQQFDKKKKFLRIVICSIGIREWDENKNKGNMRDKSKNNRIRTLYCICFELFCFILFCSISFIFVLRESFTYSMRIFVFLVQIVFQLVLASIWRQLMDRRIENVLSQCGMRSTALFQQQNQ